MKVSIDEAKIDIIMGTEIGDNLVPYVVWNGIEFLLRHGIVLRCEGR